MSNHFINDELRYCIVSEAVKRSRKKAIEWPASSEARMSFCSCANSEE